MNKIPKIIAGQNFTVNVDLSYFGTAAKLDLTTCTDITVNFICPKHNECLNMEYKISDNKLVINVDRDTLHTGTYGLEIKGKDSSSNYFRFKLKPYEFLMVVDATSEVSNTNDWEIISNIDLNARIGFNYPETDVELSNYVDKYTLASDLEKIEGEIDKKQDALVSGTNIKTINGSSILGSGDFKINSSSIDLTGYGTISYINAEDNKLKEIISLKVNKEDGKALSSNDYTNEEKTKLASMVNYDDTAIIEKINNKQDTLVSGKNVKTINGSSILGVGNILISGGADLINYATTSYVNAEDTKLQNNIDTKVDKVDGKSLISDTEITRLAGVSNYDDTAINKAVTDEASLRLNNDLLIKTDLNTETTRAKQAEADITASIPTKVSQLTNDSNYQTDTQVNDKIKAVVGAAPEALDTLEEIAKQMATDESAASSITTSITNLTTRVSTNEANIANKVDKVDGKSLISDTEITRLSTVTKYDDTNITKSVSDEKSAREAADTTLQTNIDKKQDTLVSATNIKTINGTSILGSGNIVTTASAADTVDDYHIAKLSSLPSSPSSNTIYFIV